MSHHCPASVVTALLPPRVSAREIHVPKMLELEDRIARLEIKLQRAAEDLEHTRQRISALQARLDHYSAGFGQI